MRSVVLYLILVIYFYLLQMMLELSYDFQLNQESHSSMGDKERLNDNINYHHETLVLLLVISSKLAFFLDISYLNHSLVHI